MAIFRFVFNLSSNYTICVVYCWGGDDEISFTKVGGRLRLIILQPNSSDTTHNAMGPTGDPHATQHADDTVDCNIL